MKWEILFGAILAVAVAHGGEFVIAKRDQVADCAIVVSPDASVTEKRAAKELRDYTKRMTGVELVITTNAVGGKAIVIDRRKSTSPRDADMFSIKVGGNRLSISGGKRGVLYGAYELLERFGGCDWYAPWCEEVPEREAFAVPDDLDFADSPAFMDRSTNWRHTREKDKGAFAAKMRLNGFPHAGMPFCGGTSVRFAPGLYADNAFNTLVPAKEHFAKHPEWFSEVRGVRVGESTQLCWSNDEMRNFLVERLKERLRKVKCEQDTLLVASIGQNDWGNWCQCSKCAAATKVEGSPAGPNLRFANAVAEEIEKEFPDVIIATHAYQWSRRPPKITKARRNVMVQLCAFECGFAMPFEKATDPRTKSFYEDLKGWGAVCDKLSIRQYGTCFTYYLYPFPDLFSYGSHVRLYRDCNAMLLNTQCCGDSYHADLAELKCYVQSKLMWNPDQPIEPLIDKFLKGFYGAAAPFMRKYIDDLYAAMGVPMAPDAMPDLDHVQGGIYTQVIPQLTDEILDGLYATLREGEKAVANDETRLFNVRMAEFAPIMVRLARLYGDNFRRVWAAEDIVPHVAGMEKLKPVAADLFAHIAEAGKRKHPIQLAENWRGRHLPLMADFRSLTNWTPPEKGCSLAIATTNDAVKHIYSERAWHLPIREIACDEGVKYRVRAHIRPSQKPRPRVPGINYNGFGYGVRVEWRKQQPKGSVHKRIPAKDVKPYWAWYDLGEYDLAALQKYPRPTLDWLCLFVQGDVELDQFEISRGSK